MDEGSVIGVYGLPPDGLAAATRDAMQLSPLIPGSARLDDLGEAALDRMIMLAPPGTVERRYAVALGLKALRPRGRMVVMAPKHKGGARLGDELRGFGCSVAEEGRRHHRICEVERPAALGGIEDAVADGAPRLVAALDAWSQPGVFSWDRLDPGSALLIDHLPPLAGHGADLGCGIGLLSRAVLKAAKVKALTGIETDRRALDAARRNIDDPRVDLRWLDLRGSPSGLAGLDFIVMNPPFHGGGGGEDHALGRMFIARAAESLRPGGTLWLVANRHLPYEAALVPAFRSVMPGPERGGFKILQARR